MTSDLLRGEASKVVCPACGYQNEPGANFCSECGANLKEASPDEALRAAAGEPTTELELSVDLFRHPAVLIVTAGSAAGSRFELSQDLVTAGRHGDSNVFLDDITVSRRHAEFYRDGLVWRVKDMGSLNGTYLNGRRVEDTGLKNGDVLQVGRFKLVFHDGSGR
ncbi:MAG: FHA domain-containing protein [bacterium]|nr:FHA domain-containing protein [bacterium]